MTKCVTLFLVFYLCFVKSATSQTNIYTSEGSPALNRWQLVNDCLEAMKKDRSDQSALAICDCQADKLDGRFSRKEYDKYTKDNIINLSGLIHTDTTLEKELQDCYAASGKTILFQAQGFEKEFLEQCSKSIHASSAKTFQDYRVANFCRCQLQLVKTKKLSDAEMRTLTDPNSLLFFEFIYRCGDPFAGNTDFARNWTPSDSADIKGPVADTVNVLNLGGMTYVKMKIGSLVEVWLFDTGASDLLINTEMESTLKKENVLTTSNYLGIGEYELANGTVDSCRRYRINNVRVGHYSVDNVNVAVSEKGKRIIVGKSLLNKFRNWSLNNQENKLVFTR